MGGWEEEEERIWSQRKGEEDCGVGSAIWYGCEAGQDAVLSLGATDFSAWPSHAEVAFCGWWRAE